MTVYKDSNVAPNDELSSTDEPIDAAAADAKNQQQPSATVFEPDGPSEALTAYNVKVREKTDINDEHL